MNLENRKHLQTKTTFFSSFRLILIALISLGSFLFFSCERKSEYQFDEWELDKHKVYALEKSPEEFHDFLKSGYPVHKDQKTSFDSAFFGIIGDTLFAMSKYAKRINCYRPYPVLIFSDTIPGSSFQYASYMAAGCKNPGTDGCLKFETRLLSYQRTSQDQIYVVEDEIVYDNTITVCYMQLPGTKSSGRPIRPTRKIYYSKKFGIIGVEEFDVFPYNAYWRW